MLPTGFYYFIKPAVPRRLQLFLRRQIVAWKISAYRNVWPIDEKAGSPPPGWLGWPQGKRFALVLTHDVDTARGHERSLRLMELEESLGFRSSFNFVPRRYNVSPEIRLRLAERGFEIGVHGLFHDGKYYSSKKEFLRRAFEINRYMKEWGAVGYRAPSMLHKLDWFHHLNIEYDASTFDTDPFEPNPVGMGTIFPFMVAGNRSGGYVELPYTVPQDFTLFISMREKNLDIWERKIDWIAKKGGMVLMLTHPDYMNFSGSKNGREEYTVENYKRILEHIKSKYNGQYWHALPREIAGFWVERTGSRRPA